MNIFIIFLKKTCDTCLWAMPIFLEWLKCTNTHTHPHSHRHTYTPTIVMATRARPLTCSEEHDHSSTKKQTLIFNDRIDLARGFRDSTILLLLLLLRVPTWTTSRFCCVGHTRVILVFKASSFCFCRVKGRRKHLVLKNMKPSEQSNKSNY